MTLMELGLDDHYQSPGIVDAFYIPCLANSVTYKRAVGYFTSASLAVAAKGVTAFVDNGGTMQLIASPVLLPEDARAISKGYAERLKRVETAVLRELNSNEHDPIVAQRLGFLAWLVSEGLLDVKLATREKGQGIYHEKMGVFEDSSGNVVAFSGSPNETRGGLYDNYESIDVFRSWETGDRGRVRRKVSHFDDLWNNQIPGVETLEFPDACRRRLLQYKPASRPYGDPESDRTYVIQIESSGVRLRETPPQTITVPSSIALRDYQKDAIRAWFQANGQGVLEMATGTGKTITALSAASKVYENLGRLALIVSCPFTHLATQWIGEMRSFGLRPIAAFSSRSRWEESLNADIRSFGMGDVSVISAVTTNATFSSEVMRKTLARIDGPALLVGDEVHYMGAKRTRACLPRNIRFRLGLSATPHRWLDDEGNELLFDYFGSPVFEFGLREAIQGGYLTPYYYHPVLVDLSDQEAEEYHILSKKISQVILAADDEDVFNASPGLQHLLFKRARLIGSASGKVATLRDVIMEQGPSTHSIFYCGDGRVEGERQIEVVMRTLGHELGLHVHPFTARESNEERQRLLQQFEAGELEGLVAIRCLDEGVDVPATRTAYILASSSNPRQFVQRRGRILRKHPSKEHSSIYDFIVVPRNVSDVRKLEADVFNIERRLMERELRRFVEFARLAVNGPQASRQLLPIKKAYNLLHL